MSKSILDTIDKDGFSFARLVDSFPELSALKQVPQNPAYHAEGDVYCHTEMVCEVVRQEFEQKNLKPETGKRADPGWALLFLAAAFHDIGKKTCTRNENGNFVSPNHTSVGAKLFRTFAYREAPRFGLTFSQRELVANAIRYHGLPVWFWKKQRPEADLLKVAESVPLWFLYQLSYADVRGRRTENPEEFIEYVEWFAEYARELGIWEHPYSFANSYTKASFFMRDDLWQGTDLFDNTEFDVFLLSGLPLAGKDSWIEKNGGEIPMISLDQIRGEMGIPPAKNSGKIAHIAMERAKVFLAKKQPFFWNATNIVRETRRKLITLFSSYGARVHILYLEVPYQELLARNRTRARHIPEGVLEEMINKLEIPAPWESYKVKYLTKE